MQKATAFVEKAPDMISLDEIFDTLQDAFSTTSAELEKMFSTVMFFAAFDASHFVELQKI